MDVFGRVNKTELANDEARRLRVAAGKAADQVERVVQLIIHGTVSG